MTAARGFKGYDLTPAQQQTTLAVRITLAETAADTAARQAAQQSGAAFDPYAPAPGSGLARAAPIGVSISPGSCGTSCAPTADS